ncbi:MAG: MFS family permease [Gammaproteobacteria bacterium]|jgi:MFS family permease
MRALLPVSALLISVAILLAGNGLQGVLLPVRAGLEHFSELHIGLIASCYYAGFAVGCVLGPKLVKKVGHIRAFSAMTAAAAVAPLIHGLTVLPIAWFVFRGLSGFCFAVLYIVIESWLNERSTKESRGLVLAAYMVINLTLTTAGQMLLPIYDPAEMALFAIVAILVSLAAIPIAVTGNIAPAPIASTKLVLKKLYDVSPVGVLGCCAVGFANSAFWALGPMFASTNKLDTTGIALFMSATVIGGALGQWPLGYLSDRIDRRKVIILAASLSVTASAMLVVRPLGTDMGLFLMAGVWGAAAFPLYSLTIAHANDFAEPEEFVQVSSGLLLVYSGGAVLGPIVASAMVGMFGFEYLYVYPAIVYGALIIFVYWRMLTRAPSPPEAQVAFTDALQSTKTVSSVFDQAIQERLEEETRQL